MSEFYAKAVFKTIYSTLAGASRQDFFDILVVIVLENTADQQNLEKELMSQMTIAKSNLEETIGDETHGDSQLTIGLLRKNLEDLQHKLLDCRREVLVGFKLMGDLVDTDICTAHSAIDMLLSILRSAKNQSVFDELSEDIQLGPQDIVNY
jgi:hypothetical protein